MKIKTMAISGIIAALYVAVTLLIAPLGFTAHPISDFRDVQPSCRVQ